MAKRFKRRKSISAHQRVWPVPAPPRVIAGFPEFWQPAYDRFPNFYKATTGLVPLVNEVLKKPLTGQLQIVLGFMGGIVSNSLGALITLCLNGYGQDALRVARGMFETSVNAAYLQLHRDEVDDYVDYHWVKQKKLLDYMTKHHPEDAKRIPAKTVADVDAEYAKVSPRFTDKFGKVRNSWCKNSIRRRAEEVGLGEFYPTFYARASGIHHGDIAGLTAQAKRGRLLEVELAPSFVDVKDALMMGHQCVIVVIDALNKVAVLGIDNQLNAAIAAYGDAWK